MKSQPLRKVLLSVLIGHFVLAIIGASGDGVQVTGNGLVQVINSQITQNGGDGVDAGNAGGIIRIGKSAITGNAGAGMRYSGSARVVSLSGNSLLSNNPNGTPFSTVSMQ